MNNYRLLYLISIQLITFIFSVNQKFRVGLSLIYLIILMILSLMPSKDVPDIGLFPDFDKFVHVCLYLGFAWLLCWSLKTENRPFLYFLILLFAFAWGLFMEVSQYLMHEGRNFEVLDIISNTSGALIGVFIYHYMVRIKKQSVLKKK